MAKIIEGERIGKTAPLKVGCAAAIFDESHKKLLLTRRSDNGQWCLPGGGMEPDESTAEACEREVLEETGLHVTADTPHRYLYVSAPNHIERMPDIFAEQTAAFIR
jgi:8-oxo-dGTP pyrophosphatase MutT (NUDIX family)|tara:strand:- start:72 stop:389 length:318 start_codon:yes stop_codon:yes gene_type:complete